MADPFRKARIEWERKEEEARVRREEYERMTPEERETETKAFSRARMLDTTLSVEDRKAAALNFYGWGIIPDAVLEGEIQGA